MAQTSPVPDRKYENEVIKILLPDHPMSPNTQLEIPGLLVAYAFRFYYNSKIKPYGSNVQAVDNRPLGTGFTFRELREHVSATQRELIQKTDELIKSSRFAIDSVLRFLPIPSSLAPDEQPVPERRHRPNRNPSPSSPEAQPIKELKRPRKTLFSFSVEVQKAVQAQNDEQAAQLLRDALARLHAAAKRISAYATTTPVESTLRNGVVELYNLGEIYIVNSPISEEDNRYVPRPDRSFYPEDKTDYYNI